MPRRPTPPAPTLAAFLAHLVPPGATVQSHRFDSPHELQITYIDDGRVEVVTWAAVSWQEVET